MPVRQFLGAGTFDDVAGFRIGRGRAGRPQAQSQQQPYGGQAPHGGRAAASPQYGGPAAPPSYPQPSQGYGYPHTQAPPQGATGSRPPYGQSWTQPAQASAGPEGPEYFGEEEGYGGSGPDSYAANNPGHTQSFSIGEDPYNEGGTYRAGQAAAPPVGPRLHWKDLISGVVLRPRQTFMQMRDYSMWGTALTVTFLYGLLAVFGFNGAREDAINSTISTAVPIVLTTGVVLVISLFIMGVVTHTLARQLGGDGAWQPTVGLSMLIMSLTDAPRLLFAVFMGGDESFVRVLGGVTWIGAGALLTLMVSRSHDLPWPKALGASAIQLVALLSLLKLGTF